MFTRRGVLGLFAIPLRDPIADSANEFAEAYRIWADIRNATSGDPRLQGTINLAERKAWMAVERKWDGLKAELKRERRGF